jgi:hypothetical protein
MGPSFGKRCFTLLGAFLIWSESTHASWIDSYSTLIAFLDGNPSSSLVDVLHRLDPEIRKRFQLVYESKSPNPSSLETPRIVLSNSDATLLLGVPGSDQGKRGNVIEIIQTDPETGVLHFREITFGTGAAKVDSKPAACIKCHGNPTSELGRSPMRPIWDGYPDWPGVFGSSHNQGAFYDPTKAGSGSFPKLEFEEKAFAQLKVSAQTSPRYSALIGLSEISTEALANHNTAFTEALFRRNLMSLVSEFEQAVYELYLRSPKEYEKFRQKIYQEDWPESFQINLMNEIGSAIDAENESKTSRIYNLIDKYGTSTDKRLLIEGVKNLFEDELKPLKLRVNYTLDPKLNVFPTKPLFYLALAGVDPRTISISRRLALNAPGSGTSGHYEILMDNLHAVIAHPKRPKLSGNANKLCKILVYPVKTRDSDETLKKWFTWLFGDSAPPPTGE